MHWRKFVAAAFGVVLPLSLSSFAHAADAHRRGVVGQRTELQERQDCGPYGRIGPWGGCIPGGKMGAGNYYFPGPPYFAPTPDGAPEEAPAAHGAAPQDYGPGYWGALPYGIPAFQ